MDADRTKLKQNPKDRAGILSKMFFLWTIPIFKTGLSKVLEISDLYVPVKGDFSNDLGDVLERHWTNQLRKNDPSLFRALLATFKWHVIFLATLSFFNELFIRMYQPIMLGYLLAFFAPDSTMSTQEGLWYAGGVVGLNFMSAFITNHNIVSSFHLGMRARVAVCSLIYRKSLRLSRTALGESAPGKVVNLLSNDVNRFDIASFFVNYIWAAPLSAVIVMVLLFNEVGISGIYGVLVVFTVMPLQAYTGKLSAHFRLQTALRTDERTRLMDEIILGVQVIKMYAWEKPFAALIDAARRSELKAVIKISYVRAIFMTFMLFTTRAAIFVTMLSLVFQGYGLSANRVFVFAQFFSILSHTMSSMFVRAITEIAEARVSIRRLQKYLNHAEFVVEASEGLANGEPKDLEKADGDKMELAVLENGVLKSKTFSDLNNKYGIRIVDATARWGDLGEPILKDINLDVKKGRLIGVIGPVGSGKSSLLQMILGEMTFIEQSGSKGHARAQGVVSYACQEPWVFGGTVRQNILFGVPYNRIRYNDVIRVCALQRDIELFPHGDNTLVGERGTSLSGGQKARINLARAVYRQADIYLMDDPLSAVDAAVGRQLFENCISKFLRNKTRILVTHQLHLLKKADHIVVLIDGKVEMQGTFDKVSQSGLEFARLLDKPAEEEDEEDEAIEEELHLERGRSVSLSQRHKMGRQISQVSGRTQRSSSIISGSSMLDVTEFGSQASLPPQTLAAEASSKGIVEGSIFMHYVRAGGNYCFLLVIAAMFGLAQALASGFDYFVSYWTSQEELRAYYDKLNPTSTFNATVREFNLSSTPAPDSNMLTTLAFDGNMTMDVESMLPTYDSLLSSEVCMTIHGSIVIALLIVATSRSFLFYNMCMKSSFKLHNLMFRGVIRSPMIFFDKNPSGRIMNRFSKDMGAIDESLPKAIMDASQMLLTMVSAIILSSIVNPIAIAVLAVLFIVFYFVRKCYLKTSKNIKRLEGIARSPVFTHLNATLQGLSTIRAHNAQTILKAEFDKLQDTHTSAWYMFITTSSAFGFSLDLMCIAFVASVTFSFLYMTGILGDQVGLAITQSMSLTFLLQWGIRQSAEVENQLMAVERIVEYTQLPAEKGCEPDDIDRKRAYGLPLKSKLEPPRGWPENARIVFDNLVMRYSDEPDSPLVLKGLNFTIESRQKVGIVGRTGAGKSSIIQALFRLAFNLGSIEIDGINISDISLKKLRRRISIIPQDPMLFSGTIRKNLDPFDEYSDQMLWDSLEEVELKEAIASGGAGLAGRVMDGGSNFSVGQRQLVCLARALLRKNTILLMDEATANVDPYTDALIQQTIRTKFANCTVLTIAHRLNTIMDSDIVVVMDAGLVVEFGPPSQLLELPEGHFTRMVNETKEPDEKNAKKEK